MKTLAVHWWRVLAVVGLWNLLLLADSIVLGLSVYGPFSLAAYTGMTALLTTLPIDKRPGSLLMRVPPKLGSWKWLFWYGAALVGLAAIFTAYRLVCLALGIQAVGV